MHLKVLHRGRGEMKDALQAGDDEMGKSLLFMLYFTGKVLHTQSISGLQ